MVDDGVIGRAEAATWQLAVVGGAQSIRREGGAGMKVAVSFTNLGPYHLARLGGLSAALTSHGEAVAIETAGVERRYPWESPRTQDLFRRITLWPGHALEDLPPGACARRMGEALDAEQPDAVAVSGYVRPECLEALRWGHGHGVPVVLMSESQANDRPRVWWKEAVKRRRVRRFDAALVGGPSHRDYLVELGADPDRIALGYNAVDHEAFVRVSDEHRHTGSRPVGRRYFLSVCRFVTEKDLGTLVQAFAAYRRSASSDQARDLVLCGDGPERTRLQALARAEGVEGAVHWPGFRQAQDLGCWYAFADAFVLPSRSEPWGLVANEAAACAVPLVVSDRAGCSGTLVPDPPGTTGFRFEAGDVRRLAGLLGEIATLEERDRAAMGARARAVASNWGPQRFGLGLLEAIEKAAARRRGRGRAVSGINAGLR